MSAVYYSQLPSLHCGQEMHIYIYQGGFFSLLPSQYLVCKMVFARPGDRKPTTSASEVYSVVRRLAFMMALDGMLWILLWISTLLTLPVRLAKRRIVDGVRVCQFRHGLYSS